MATYTQSGIMTFKDSSGNLYRMYPVTEAANVNCEVQCDLQEIGDATTVVEAFETVGDVLFDRIHGVTTAGTGAAYTAAVDGIGALTVGTSFVMVPNVVSTSTAPTLNVNSLGAKTIRRRISGAPSATAAGPSASWLAASKPIRVTYNGTYWVTDDIQPNAEDLYGDLYTYGTTDMTAGTSTLATGKLYFVYE